MNQDGILSFECVRPTEEHARLIMEWRNDPDTLAMSYHQTPKAFDTFFKEFTGSYFAFPDLPPLFAAFNGQRVAFLRFRPISHPQGLSRRCCDISINVAPDFRRQGYGKNILKEMTSWMARQGYEDLYAEVKKENLASQNTFLAAGFKKLDDGVVNVFDTGELVPISRFMFSSDASKDKNPLSSSRVFVIAEAGSNWCVGKSAAEHLAMAKKLIEAAVEAKASAIKFQVFRPQTLYVPNAGASDYLAEAGIKEAIYEIIDHLSMPYDMIPKLAEACRRAGILFMATPFSAADFAAVDPYVDIHKIASYEIGHMRLLELAARSGKPIILSTGAATEDEINWSVNFLRSCGAYNLSLLQCTAAYPASPSSMHLRSIQWLQKRFLCPVGLSDHSKHPLYAPIAAVALGASIIEKHITMDRTLPGPDHAFAIVPSELEQMVQAIDEAALMRGSEVKKIDPSEAELRDYARRGLQAICDIRPGDVFHEDKNVAILRPGKQQLGVHPKWIADIEGKVAKRPIALGDGIQYGDW